jgi:hypothetical protein
MEQWALKSCSWRAFCTWWLSYFVQNPTDGKTEARLNRTSEAYRAIIHAWNVRHPDLQMEWKIKATDPKHTENVIVIRRSI